MRFLSYRENGLRGVACLCSDGVHRGFTEDDPRFPGTLDDLVKSGPGWLDGVAGIMLTGERMDPDAVELLPPLELPGKIICIGLNYVEHAHETSHAVPSYPTVFLRSHTSLVGARAGLVKPDASDAFDYEGEFAAVIGKSGRNISGARALDHVLGYTLFNDASARDFQKKSSQWTMGKNFDGTGAMGPWLVTADELPEGAEGLKIQTRVNGRVMQEASTSDLVFGVAKLVELLSAVMTLEAGDVIVTGTPGGVGMARNPPCWLAVGDVVEIEMTGLGCLHNQVV